MAVTREDLRLFISHVSWLTETMDIGADALLEMLTSRFQHDWIGLRLALIIDQPEQIRAEEALVELLGRDIRRPHRRLRWGDEPGREVDWCRTSLEVAVRGPGQYANLEQVHRPDLATRGALVALATRWRRILQVAGLRGREARARRLDALIAAAGVQGTGWSVYAERRLRSLDPQLARTILTALTLWSALRGVRLRSALERWAREQDERNWDPENQDNLYEWTASLGVVRAAVASGWTVQPWKGLLVEHGYPNIHLTRDDQVCRVSKGHPCDGRGQRLADPRHAPDTLSKLIKETGNDAKGGQPDIVITFWRRQTPEYCVTFLADAKRNVTGDGKRYLENSIAKGLVYASAYRSHLHADPKVTLFFYQAVNQVVSVKTPPSEPDQWRDTLSEALGRASLPEVMAFDLRHMGGENGLIWHPQPLCAWFERLAAEARKVDALPRPNIVTALPTSTLHVSS